MRRIFPVNHDWNFNRTSGTSTAQAKLQPHEQNFNRMSETSTA
ncbi:hypothetical protein [Virgibacillus ihumii]|nr:hypothetical protein [Virgibacillus ihumii]